MINTLRMKKIVIFFSILILTLITLRYLCIPGFFPMHDDAQVARVVSMGKALTEGQFPVRIVPGLGYGLGYPIFNFYGPLPYYVGGALYVLGISGLAATKIMIGVGVSVGVLAMYFLGSYLFGLGGGLVSSLFLFLLHIGLFKFMYGGLSGNYGQHHLFPWFFWDASCLATKRINQRVF